MAFTLPVFNVQIYVWHDGAHAGDPPDIMTYANFATGKRVNHLMEGEVVPGAGPFGFSYILFPTGVDIRGDTETGGSGDTIEIPSGSGRWYHCMWADITAMGFANEHGVGTVIRLPASPLPPAADILLLEDGTDLLLEDGTPFLME